MHLVHIFILYIVLIENDIMENKELFIKDEQEYDAAMARIETLIAAIPEDAPAGTSQGIELRLLARAVQHYEQATCRMRKHR